MYVSTNLIPTFIFASNLSTTVIQVGPLGKGTWYWRIGSVFDGIETSLSPISSINVKTCQDGSIDIPQEQCGEY